MGNLLYSRKCVENTTTAVGKYCKNDIKIIQMYIIYIYSFLICVVK